VHGGSLEQIVVAGANSTIRFLTMGENWSAPVVDLPARLDFKTVTCLKQDFQFS